MCCTLIRTSTCDGRYGYAETHLKPSCEPAKVEVSHEGEVSHISALKPVTGAEDEAEIQRALSVEGGWLIMHRSLILDEDVAEAVDTDERANNDAEVFARN